MRIAIVDDEVCYTEQLRDYLRKYQIEFDRRLEVTCYDSGMNFIHSFKGQFDIILLDVAVPYTNLSDIVGQDSVQPSYVGYVEGIYVGYRFYETAAYEGLINYDEVVHYWHL